jgi:pimeloyl-ACP methyl ester carboxylesterase
MSQRRRVSVAYDNISIDVILNEPVAHAAESLVLPPSSSRDSEDFDDISEMFAAQGFRVIWPQPRGMCASTGPMDGLILHDYARDVAIVIERQADGAACVLGHAFGQWIGRCVAADYPHLVRGVILAAEWTRTV